MNQQQKNYLIKRITEIKEQKIISLNVHLEMPNIKESFNQNDLRTDLPFLVMSKFKEFYGSNISLNFREMFKEGSINRYEKKQKEWEDKIEKRKIERQKKVCEIQKEADNIMDNIMIGDEKEALKMLKEFENKKFV
jgi:hypothetical protein